MVLCSTGQIRPTEGVKQLLEGSSFCEPAPAFNQDQVPVSGRTQNTLHGHGKKGGEVIAK